MEQPWHALSAQEVLARIGVDPHSGLDPEEARRRLSRTGPNKLDEAEGTSLTALFLSQFKDFVVLVLIAAAGVSFLLGEEVDAAAILAIVLLNALLGCVQEYRAGRSLAVLKEMAAPSATVRRGGEVRRVAAEELVPGDVVLVKAGDRVPADARLLQATSLEVDESPLTGESLPASKEALWRGDPDTPLAERRNMLFMGTTVSRGRGEAVVVATGMATEIGDVAAMIEGSGEELTPLQRRLAQLGRWLVLVCLSIVAAVFVAGVARGASVYEMFLTGTSLAVAAIPEGLPAVVTVALALGVQRMIRRQAIVRRLPAVETLGCATVICTDKTGTLTRNEMTVVKLILADREIDVSGSGYDPAGEFRSQGSLVDPRDPDLHWALLAGACCNDAVMELPGRSGKAPVREKAALRILGDATEAALLVAAYKGGIDPKELARSHPRVAEIPFDSNRKRMSVVVRQSGGLTAYVKGAPDVVLQRCRSVRKGGNVVPLDARERQRLLRQAERMAEQALRVLALACRPVARSELTAGGPPASDALEKELIFLGLACMMDPPRPEVAKAIAKARRAGIETIMVTGDHPRTAEAIARQLGFERCSAVSGDEIDRMGDDELARVLGERSVYARVSPRHKLRIVRILKERGHVVAMTGDGVNDAPAVREADIGVAMGRTGTDVTREAAAMVLADDNYATLVAAIQEGRGIYDNIRKFARYLLACNTGEVLSMFIAAVAGLPMPLLPTQILWVNLVTDGLPAIALGVDPPDADVMERPPRDPNEGLFARGLHLKIAARGVLIGLATVASFLVGMHMPPLGADPLPYARTLAFTTLVASQLVYVFQCRSERRLLHEMGLWENPWLFLAVTVSAGMHLLVIYSPVLSRVFETVRLSAADWALVILLSSWSQLLESGLARARRVILRRISMVRV